MTEVKDLIGSRVIGMRREFVVGEQAGEQEFSEEPCESIKYTIFCSKKIYDDYSQLFAIELYDIGGWCGSGYTTASWGIMHIDEIEHVGPITHKPKDPNLMLKYDDEYKWFNEENTNVFGYSSDGGDIYYPYGGIVVNEDLFEELPRAMKSRPRYIFFGDSGLGKSSLAMLLNDKKDVYETDSSETLPDIIWADIIVLGNKYHFTLDEIKKHMHETDTDNIIMVGFIKEGNV